MDGLSFAGSDYSPPADCRVRCRDVRQQSLAMLAEVSAIAHRGIRNIFIVLF